jgi:aminoglycoside 3-N-acetyltransferase
VARPAAITRSELASGLHALGVRPGAMLMVHTRMSALGWVVGGSETVVRALLDAVGPQGTLMAYVGWDEHVFADDDRAPEHRAAYRAEPPVFDPATALAFHENGRLPERIRTWPGAVHSGHPEAGVVAVGARAAWLAGGHPGDDAYGARTPFARLVEGGGEVLMLGAPLDTVTLLHHAEALARVADKRRVTYRVAVAEPDGGVAERVFHDIDTGAGALPYERLGLADDALAVIARAALAAGIGVCGRVGPATCHRFGARELTAFAVAWMEERLGA